MQLLYCLGRRQAFLSSLKVIMVLCTRIPITFLRAIIAHANDQGVHHGHEIRPSRISDSEPSAALFLHHFFLEANDLLVLQYNSMKIYRTESCKRQHQVVNLRLGGREFGIGNFCRRVLNGLLTRVSIEKTRYQIRRWVASYYLKHKFNHRTLF